MIMGISKIKTAYKGKNCCKLPDDSAKNSKDHGISENNNNCHIKGVHCNLRSLGASALTNNS